MTRSMSASAPISSVIAVEGVSGEMATPAFIFRLWIAWMMEIGSAETRRWDRVLLSYQIDFRSLGDDVFAHMRLQCGSSIGRLLRLQYRPPSVPD